MISIARRSGKSCHFYQFVHAKHFPVIWQGSVAPPNRSARRNENRFINASRWGVRTPSAKPSVSGSCNHERTRQQSAPAIFLSFLNLFRRAVFRLSGAAPIHGAYFHLQRRQRHKQATVLDTSHRSVPLHPTSRRSSGFRK